MSKFTKIGLLTLSLVIVSCSKREFKPISYLNIAPEKNPLRVPANSINNKCFTDTFEIDRIRQDIATMEKTWKKKAKVPSKFEKFSLSIAQTHYVNRFHEYIFMNEQSDSCNDLQCLLNISYGDRNSEAGDRIYHWFLKMGTGISTLDKIPTYSRESFKDKTRKDFLFPVEELKFLNMISFIVSSKYKDLYISTMHRFPNGTSPGASVAGAYNGFRGAYKKPHREIFLTQQNFSYSDNGIIKGYYIHTLVHELSHALDFSYGDPDEILSKVSITPKWTDLSWQWGEAKVSYTEEVNGLEVEKEKTIMKWIPSSAKEDTFLREYMKVSPQEDFADVGAYYVVDPEKLHEKASDKFSVFQDDFYFGDSFMDVDETMHIQDDLNSFLATNIEETVKNCVLDENSSQLASSIDYTFAKKYQFLSKELSNCLLSKIDEQLLSRLERIKKQRYKACKIVGENPHKLIQKSIHYNSNKIENTLQSIESIGKAKERWGSLRNELANKCDEKSIFLETYRLHKPKEQFQSAYIDCINNVFGKYTDIEKVVVGEKELLVSKINFSRTQKNVKEAFLDATKGLKTFLKDSSGELVESCRDQADFKTNLYTPVSGGNTYVNKNSLTCINDKFDENFDTVIKEFMQGHYYSSDVGLLYITEMYMQDYVNDINDYLYTLSLTEDEKYRKHIILDADDIFKDVIQSETLNQAYTLEKNSFKDDFNRTVKDTLRKYLSQYRAPMTISEHETLIELNKKVLKLLIENSKKVSNKDTVKFNNESKQIIKSLILKYSTIKNWSSNYKSLDEFEFKCHIQVEDEINQYISSKADKYKFLSKKRMTTSLKMSVCDPLHKALGKEVSASKNLQSSIKGRVIGHLLNTTNWKSSFESSKLKNSCLASLDKDSFDLNLNQYKLLNINVVLDEILNEECDKAVSLWEGVDLFEINNRMSCMFNCVSNVPKEYSISVKDWNLYLNNSFKLLTGEINKLFKDFIEPGIFKCIEKYPKVTIASFRIKRKKCIIKQLDTKVSIKLDKYSQRVNNILNNQLVKRQQKTKRYLGNYMK